MFIGSINNFYVSIIASIFCILFCRLNDYIMLNVIFLVCSSSSLNAFSIIVFSSNPHPHSTSISLLRQLECTAITNRYYVEFSSATVTMNLTELSTLNLFYVYQVEFESFIASHHVSSVWTVEFKLS